MLYRDIKSIGYFFKLRISAQNEDVPLVKIRNKIKILKYT